MSASLWGRPRKFVVDNFPLSIYIADSQSRDIAATELGRTERGHFRYAHKHNRPAKQEIR